MLRRLNKNPLIHWIMVTALGSGLSLADGGEENINAGIEYRQALVRISTEDYADRVYASWLGQIVGNIYGLSYEFQFIDEPGPDEFPYGFGASLERVKEVNGAFSDDDTDIEYMYLLQMEKHGIEPTYQQLADAWKYHVRDKVWVANRSALTLMHAGYSPPIPHPACRTTPLENPHGRQKSPTMTSVSNRRSITPPCTLPLFLKRTSGD
jgi:hypothetical protein